MSAPPLPSGSPGGPQQQSTFFLDPRGRLRPGLRALFFLLPGFVIFVLLHALIYGVLIHRTSFLTALTISRSLITLVLLLLSWAYLRGMDGRSFRALGLWFYRGWGRELFRGCALGFAMMALTVAALVAGRGVHYLGFNHGAAQLSLILLRTLALFLVGAAAEEVLFRGYGFQRLVDSIGAIGAVTVMSTFFGAVHIGNGSATALSTANTVLAGVILSLAYLRTRALWLPIGLHWAWNFFQGEIFSLPVSGIPFAKPLLRAVAVGPAWFTGGDYGPEGGLAVTVVALAGILWLARTRRLAPSPAMQEVLE
jgi:membrane protease YdiL (CAAX protease family)